MSAFRRIVDQVGGVGDRTVMIGSDRLASEALAVGADGIVPGIGNVCPDLFVALHEAYRSDDQERLQQLQAQVDVMAEILSVGQAHGLGRHASELGALKHLLHRDGVIDSVQVSMPLTPFPSAAAAEVEAIVARVGRWSRSVSWALASGPRPSTHLPSRRWRTPVSMASGVATLSRAIASQEHMGCASSPTTRSYWARSTWWISRFHPECR